MLFTASLVMGGAETDELVAGIRQRNVGVGGPAVEKVGDGRLQAEFDSEPFGPLGVGPLHHCSLPHCRCQTGVLPEQVNTAQLLRSRIWLLDGVSEFDCGTVCFASIVLALC